MAVVVVVVMVIMQLRFPGVTSSTLQRSPVETRAAMVVVLTRRMRVMDPAAMPLLPPWTLLTRRELSVNMKGMSCAVQFSLPCWCRLCGVAPSTVTTDVELAVTVCLQVVHR